MKKRKIIYLVLVVLGGLTMGCGKPSVNKQYKPQKQSPPLFETKKDTMEGVVKEAVYKDRRLYYSTVENTKIVVIDSMPGLRNECSILLQNGNSYLLNANNIFTGKDNVYTQRIEPNMELDQKGQNGQTILEKYLVEKDTLHLIKKLIMDGWCLVEKVNSSPVAFVISESDEGAGIVHSIYSKNFEKILDFTPYKHGYKDSRALSINDKLIFITADYVHKGMYKFTSIDIKEGEIDLQKEFDLGEDATIYSSFISQKGILISYYSSTFEGKARLYDFSFNKLWETNISSSFHKVHYFPEQDMFYCQLLDKTKIHMIDGAGKSYKIIDANRFYQFEKRELIINKSTPKIRGHFVYDFIPIKGNIVGILIGRLNEGPVSFIWDDLNFFVVSSDSEVIQKIVIPGFSLTEKLQLDRINENEIKIHVGNKNYYYEIR